MVDNQFFPTAVRDPYQFESSTAKRDTCFSLPSISHRITDKGLLSNLKKNTQLRVPVVNATRAPKRSQPSSPPSFQQYNPIVSHRSIEQPQLSDDAIAIIDNPDDIPSDIEILRFVRPQLMKQRDYYSDSGDYAAALNIVSIITKVEAKLRNEESHFGEMDNVRIMLTRHQELQTIVNHFLADWNKGFDDFLRLTESDAEKLREEMENELEQYDSTKPEGIDKKICKRSPRLINLRDREIRFALLKEYEKAEEVKRVADDTEAVEAREALDKTYRSWLKARKRLVAQQKLRMENFVDHAESVRRSMIANRDKTIQGYLRRMNELDGRIDAECDSLNVKDEEVLDHPLSEARAEFVVEEEKKSPIPQFRPGMAFAMSREKRTQSAPKRKQGY